MILGTYRQIAIAPSPLLPSSCLAPLTDWLLLPFALVCVAAATRYYYNCSPQEMSSAAINHRHAGGQIGSSASISCKRWALANEKDFDTIFFPQKKELFNLLEEFSSRQGRYAIRGSQQKIGMYAAS